MVKLNFERTYCWDSELGRRSLADCLDEWETNCCLNHQVDVLTDQQFVFVELLRLSLCLTAWLEKFHLFVSVRLHAL